MTPAWGSHPTLHVEHALLPMVAQLAHIGASDTEKIGPLARGGPRAAGQKSVRACPEAAWRWNDGRTMAMGKGARHGARPVLVAPSPLRPVQPMTVQVTLETVMLSVLVVPLGTDCQAGVLVTVTSMEVQPKLPLVPAVRLNS